MATYNYAHYGETLLKLPVPHFFCISDPRGGGEDKFRERFGKHKATMLPYPPKPDTLNAPFGNHLSSQ